MLVLESKSGMKLDRVVIAPEHTQLEEIRVGLPKPISPKAHQNTCSLAGYIYHLIYNATLRIVMPKTQNA